MEGLRNYSFVEGKVGMELGHVVWPTHGVGGELAVGRKGGKTALCVGQLSLFQAGNSEKSQNPKLEPGLPSC